MNFTERIIRFCQGIFRKKSVKRATPGIAAIRQNSPPDERDVDVAEGLQASKPFRNGGFDDKDKTGKKAKTRAKKTGGGT